MATRQPILMPKLGLTMTEGVLAEWKVAPGDAVKAGDVIFIVETDKISNEIEASEDGVIDEFRVSVGDAVPVGQIVATLIASGAAKSAAAVTPMAPNAAPALQNTTKAPPPKAVVTAIQDRIIATPLARRRAAEAGLDLASVGGSGPRGRIVADDIAAIIAPRAVAPATQPSFARNADGVLRPLGQYQAVTARRLTQAKRDIPHFYIFAEADVTELVGLRERLNASPRKTKITFNHFIISAVARALAGMPAFNRVWSEEGPFEFARADIGIAIEGPKGLVAPVLRDIGERTIEEVADVAARLVETARGGRLSSKDLQGGAITISNVGMFGATGLLPIINPGQSSILGIGASQAVFRPDAQSQPRLRQVLGLSLSCDHRVIDGALAAHFLQSVQRGLESPESLSREN